jgi:hypothetical protein
VRRLVLAIDFDHVIMDTDNPVPGRRMGPPLDGARDAILSFYGHEIIIHTCWAQTESGKAAVEKWLEYWRFPAIEVTAMKPRADVYLDNKAIRFENWEQALTDIKAVSD